METEISRESSRLIRDLAVAAEKHDGGSKAESKYVSAFDALSAHVANLEAQITKHEDTDRQILACMGIGII